jgi:hypothetical protein
MQLGAPSCGDCGHVLTSESNVSSLTLQFPAEEPVLEVLPLDAQRPAPAPVLVPGLLEPAEPSSVLPVDQDERRPQWNKTAAIVGVITTVVAAVVIVALVASSHGSPTIISAGSPVAESSSVATDSPSDSTTFSVTSSPVPTDDNAARQTLQNEVTTDRPQVEALAGRWVPQLSSKRPGLVVNGTTYDYQAIWSDFASLRARYPDALLLWSGDYSGFRSPDFWVTIVPQSYGSGDSANSWCDSAGIDRDDCYAKLITHTVGYAASTVLRK